MRPTSALIASLLLSAGITASTSAKVIYVKVGGIGDGSSWTAAMGKPETAATAAVAGDEVWISSGTYVPHNGIIVKSNTSLYGGFAGTETSRNQRNSRFNVTVLDLTDNGTIFCFNGTQNVTVDGFTLKNCPSSAVNISSCTGIVITNDIITENGTDYLNSGAQVNGGGIAVTSQTTDSTISIKNCIISKNSGIYGGGLWCDGNATLTNNVFASNIARSQAGGVSLSGTLTATNNTFVANVASPSPSDLSAGGAMYLGVGSNVFLTNNIFAYNTLGVTCSQRTGITVTCSHNDGYGNGIFRGLSDASAYDYVGTTDPTGTSGNIHADPLFGDVYRNYHTQPASPCRDAGDDSVVSAGDTDVDGDARIIGVHVDIGADESNGTVIDPLAPQTFHVSTTGSDANDGLTWATAKRTLAAATYACSGGEDIWVAAGTYVVGQYDSPAVLRSSAALYGGFTGTETNRLQRDPSVNKTTLDGGQRGPVITDLGNVTTPATIDGFTITNGTSGIICPLGNIFIRDNTISGNLPGGGVYCANGPVTISRNIVNGNIGDGVDCTNSSATIRDNTISNNTGQYANGVRVSGGSMNILHNVVSGNTGAGIDAEGLSGSVTRNLVSGNFNGLEAAGVIVTDNLIVNNSSYGIYQQGAPCYNNTVVGNGGSGIVGGGALANNIVAYNGTGIDDITTSTITANDVFGNTKQFSGQADPTGTGGNIVADPLFFDRSHGNYELTAGSPCIDTGYDFSPVVTPGDVDFDGKPRKLGAHVDMGAFEFLPGGPYTVAEVGAALRIAAGLQAATPGEETRLNVVGASGATTVIDLLDSVAIARKVAGLDANP